MAPTVQCLALFVCILVTRCVLAQDILRKMISTDVLFSGAKKDAIHSHLQRMLQMDTEHEERENPENCSPASLADNKKCLANPLTDPTVESTFGLSSSKGASHAPNCKGPNCLVAPMPGQKAPTDGKEESRRQAPAQKVPYGPMTQDAFERMVQRKRAALREELQKKGELTSELEAFLQTSGDQRKDVFGIPLPARTSEPHLQRTDFEMRFKPQAPSPDPAIRNPTTTATATTTKPTSAFDSGTSAQSKLHDDFEMRFTPQSPSLDPSTLRTELEAFIAAASPAPQFASAESASAAATTDIISPHSTTVTPTSNPSNNLVAGKPEREAKSEQQQQPKQPSDKPLLSDAGAPTNPPSRPPMTDQEAARLAVQQAANAAAREAALARKRQMVIEEVTSSSSKKAKRGSVASTNPSTVSTSRIQTQSSSTSSSLSSLQRRRRTSGINIPTAAASKAIINASNTVHRRTSSSFSWGVLSFILVALLAVVSAVGLFVVAAVLEDALLGRPSSIKNGAAVTTAALPAHWLALTRGLWRRCRRAFTAARKQLTGHGSDLPMSVNEGCGPLARAFTAVSAFVHVFLTHLKHQQLGVVVTAVLDASRRASAGGVVTAGNVVPDRVSAGGATTSSYYTSTPFAAPQYQGNTHGVAAAASPSSYVIEADGSAAATATMELNLRRRH